MLEQSSSSNTVVKPQFVFNHEEDKVSDALSISLNDLTAMSSVSNLVLGKQLDKADSMSQLIEVFLNFFNDVDYNNEFKAVAVAIIVMNLMEETGAIEYK